MYAWVGRRARFGQGHAGPGLELERDYMAKRIIQEYLAHKKPPPPLGPSEEPEHSPTG